MEIATLVLRIAIGATLIVHGVRHWRTLDGTAGWFGSIGFRQPRLQAVASAVLEIGTGIALVIGFGTPFAAAVAVGTMLVAARAVHLKNGFFITSEGYEYVLNLAAAAVAVSALGSGKASIDRLLFGEDPYLNPSQRAALALLLGCAGAGVQLATFWRNPGNTKHRRSRPEPLEV